MKVLIDTDPGHDDAVAILLAGRWTELVGITTVHGNASLVDTTRNALAIAELAGLRVPVVSGAARPLATEARYATRIHGENGLAGVQLPLPRSSVSGIDAAEFIVEMSRSHDGLWLLALGPLTNLARAFERDSGLAARIAGVSMMGGSTHVGNMTATAEFNVWADPEAARVVFRSGAPIKICGLNLTHQLKTDDALLEELAAAGTPVSKFVAQLYDFMHARMDEIVGERRVSLHDPCALLALTHPHLLRFELRHVDVELTGELTRGMTVVDERPARRPWRPPNAEVGYELDAGPALRAIAEELKRQR